MLYKEWNKCVFQVIVLHIHNPFMFLSNVLHVKDCPSFQDMTAPQLSDQIDNRCSPLDQEVAKQNVRKQDFFFLIHVFKRSYT